MNQLGWNGLGNSFWIGTAVADRLLACVIVFGDEMVYLRGVTGGLSRKPMQWISLISGLGQIVVLDESPSVPRSLAICFL